MRKRTVFQVVVTSAGKSFAFNEMLGTWLRLADTGSSVQTVSDFATAAANMPPETRGHPLSSLSYLTMTSAPKLHGVGDDLRVAASVSHCQDQVIHGTLAQRESSPHTRSFLLKQQQKYFC